MIWSVFGSPSCEYSYSPVRNESPLHSFFYKVTLHTAYNYKEHLTNWGFFYISAHYCENGDPEVLRSGFMSLSAPSQLWGNGLERKKERTTTGEDESLVPCPWARHGSVTCPHAHAHAHTRWIQTPGLAVLADLTWWRWTRHGTYNWSLQVGGWTFGFSHTLLISRKTQQQRTGRPPQKQTSTPVRSSVWEQPPVLVLWEQALRCSVLRVWPAFHPIFPSSPCVSVDSLRTFAFADEAVWLPVSLRTRWGRL